MFSFAHLQRLFTVIMTYWSERFNVPRTSLERRFTDTCWTEEELQGAVYVATGPSAGGGASTHMKDQVNETQYLIPLYHIKVH